MTKPILKSVCLLVVLITNSLWAQQLPSNSLFEFSTTAGFTVYNRDAEVANLVVKNETPEYEIDRFSNRAGAIGFDGSSSVSITGESLDFGNGADKQMTLSLWFKTSTVSNTFFIITKAKNGWLGSNDFDYGVSCHASNGLTFITGPSSDTVNYFESGIFPTLNEWHHLVMTIDPDGETSGMKKAYVDGVKVMEAAYLSRGQSYPGSSLIIGKGKSGIALLNGGVDDVIVYDRVLSENEVQDLYTIDDNYRDFPMLHLKFNGTTADSSIFSNTLSTDNLSFAADRHGNEESSVYLSSSSNSFLEVDNEVTLDFGRGEDIQFSYSFWYKQLNPIATSSYSILTKASIGWNGSGDFDYGLSSNATQGMIPFTGPSNDAGNYPTDVLTVSDTLWHHVALVCDQTGLMSGLKTVYFDGQEIVQNSYSSKGAVKNGNLVFGRGKSGIARFEGFFDDVLIYRKALSSSEVQDLYDDNTLVSVESPSYDVPNNVYPNPTEGLLTVGTGYIKIYNNQGIQVFGRESNGIIDVSNLDSGLYYYVIGNKNGSFLKQ